MCEDAEYSAYIAVTEALLDRFEREGYSPDMADELCHLSSEYTPHRVADVEYVLPDGLKILLDTAYRRFHDDEEAEEAEEARESASPRDQFEFHNPAHLDWLANQLHFWRFL